MPLVEQRGLRHARSKSQNFVLRQPAVLFGLRLFLP
jgi:hypothetical protein